MVFGVVIQKNTNEKLKIKRDWFFFKKELEEARH